MTRLPLLLSLSLACTAPLAQERKNTFDDPFLQVTSALPGCPAPRPPGYTEEEVRKEAHVRAQHGTSCYRVGRCRLPNSYLYDKEIIPRVKTAILVDGRFADTSVSVLGQRRWVILEGCVRTDAQKKALAALVRGIDDVEAVIDELAVRKR